MKAYMSRIDYWRGIPDHGPVQAGLDELQTILAETEPGIEYGDLFDVCDLSHNERAALAEGLAWFISQEID